MMLANELPRLLRGTPGTPLTLGQHEATYATTFKVASLLDELEASGLTGRGGAAFPTARKARLLRDQRGHNKVVVVNAMEGEPVSYKDTTLLSANPHLVLDGAAILASIIGAKDVVVCVSRDNPNAVGNVQRALDERERAGAQGPQFKLETAPWRYVAGEESALVHWLNDNESLPQYRPQRPAILKIRHHAVLLDNVETCANVALIGRFGAAWFRALGTAVSPGSVLVTVTGALERAKVLEVVPGMTLRAVLNVAGADADSQAVLLGGYGGSWLDAAHLDTPYDNESLAQWGASVGAGIVVVLGREGCGVVETQRVVQWMANESARQCGPCAFGLPALSDDLAEVGAGRRDASRALQRLEHRCVVIEGRGACRHPDGVVRLVRSALRVFAGDFEGHARGAPCSGSRSRRFFVAVPRLEKEHELVWE
ncbi:MAG TPA: NADH-ubiquinone oxidoreductase-F iron-sulfur binding region domain-containing protein [Acidimicrobiales bacterium]|nr:NADH-ubiquinone oxidoreductase-F iron-sulfur binding region domain-containing protein [Acidimicrobiales bacterium]